MASDGANPDAIAAIAARRRGDARLFTVGVSADVNSSLIERLAVEGRGTAHFVRTGENVERPVSLLASRLTNPVLTNVRVHVDGVRLSQVLPSGSIDIFAGQDLEATDRAREYIVGYPPSSPSVALFKDGELVYFMERRSIEGRHPEDIAADLRDAYARWC